MKGNVVNVSGWFDGRKLVSDLEVGEEGFAVSWAYNRETNMVKETYMVSQEPGGTYNMLVRCVSDEPRRYALFCTKDNRRPVKRRWYCQYCDERGLCRLCVRGKV